MRILHLIGGGDTGGAKTHIYSLLRRLTQQPGLEVLLVPLRHGPFADEAAALGIPTRVVAAGTRATLSELRRLIRGDEGAGFDLLHCHGARANLWGALLKLGGLKTPVVTTVHSDYKLDYLGRPLARCTFGVLNAWALRRMDAYIGVSDPVTDLLADRGFPPDKLYTIYNGIEIQEEPPSRRPDGIVTAGIAARLDPVKDHATLLRALAAAKHAALTLKIAGDGPERHRLMSLCEKLGIRDRVEFLGWVETENMPDFFRSIDINLITSRYETFPYALTEGARTACATIATGVGGIPRLIDPEVSGLLFTPGDVSTLASHLTRLADDAGLRESLGRRLRDKAIRCFSLDGTIDTQIEIYRRLLAPRKPGFLLCGAYGKDNLGDDAMLIALTADIAAEFPGRSWTVMSRRPGQTKRRFRVRTRHTFNLAGFLREARRSAVFLSGGGNLLQDDTSSRSLWFYLGTLWLAKRLGCKVVMIGCGVGGLRKPRNRRLTARVVNACVDRIALREADSRTELASLGITRPAVTLTADPALTLRPADSGAADSYFLSQGLSLEGAYFCLALRPWPGGEARLPDWAALCEYVCHRYGLTPVFMAIEPRHDTDIAVKTASRLRCPYRLLDPIQSPALASAVLGRMRAVVSMRLHALVLSAGSGVPLVGISYSEKVSAFMTALGCRTCVPLADANADALTALFDAALSEDAGARLTRAAQLRQAAAGNMDAIHQVLNDQ